MEQYDQIGQDYIRINMERSDRACIMVPTARHYLGSLEGKRVLDLACGNGFFSRLIALWGANSVLGVDISPEMIRTAKAEEAKQPLGVRYQTADVAQMEKLGEFDIVFAAFLLHYAPDVQNLRAMCKQIRANLKPDGKFIAFNENPAVPLHTTPKYDVIPTAHGPIADGVKIERAHFANGKKDFSLFHYHYEPETYAAALQDAGFSRFEWKRFVKGPAADEGYPPGYWDDYTGHFSIAVLEAHP